jgi:hypothetical protein
MRVVAVRSRIVRWAIRLCVLLLVAGASPLAAQDPVPRDTLPAPVGEDADTVLVPVPPERVAQDTLPTPVEPAPVDTIGPAPNFPRFPTPPATGFAEDRWEWGPAELDRWHGMSLLALLEQVPGLLVTRGGWYGRPAGIAAYGLGGGRVRVFLDGFELDPLESATLDVQHVAIVDLERVRVVRTLAETRIELFTFAQPDERAYSEIEAATAIFRTRILRGIFSATTGQRGVLTVGLDLTDSDGWGGAQPFSTNSLLARWGYQLGEQTGVQLEVRQSSLERTGAPFAFQGNRRDLMLRFRSLPRPGLALDAMVGQSSRRPGDRDTLQVELASLQGALRARYDLGFGWLGAGTRLRGGNNSGFAAPSLDLSAEAGLQPVPWFGAIGEVRSTHTGGIVGTELQGTVRLSPLPGLSAFASAASGTRVVGTVADTLVQIATPVLPPVTGAVFTDATEFQFPTHSSQLSAFRAGAELNRWGVRLGGAYVVHDVDRVVPFGLAFDRTLPPVDVGLVSGVEAFGSVPLLYRPLRLEGAYSHWFDVGGRPYLPLEHGRVALVFNERFYDGNLEPTLRVEAVGRGRALVPTPDRTAFDAVSEPYGLLNLFLQIRILDVRAFLIWDNLLNNVTAADLPGPGFGRLLGGQRAIYGVRWHFFN